MTDLDHRSPQDRLDRLEAIAGQLLQRCRERGATQAEVSCSEEQGLGVDVRMGDVETVESTRDRGIGVTVYFGKRKGSASTADLQADSLGATVDQACAIARSASRSHGCHPSKSRRSVAMRSASARPAAGSASVCRAIAHAWSTVAPRLSACRSAVLALPLRCPK